MISIFGTQIFRKTDLALITSLSLSICGCHKNDGESSGGGNPGGFINSVDETAFVRAGDNFTKLLNRAGQATPNAGAKAMNLSGSAMALAQRFAMVEDAGRTGISNRPASSSSSTCEELMSALMSSVSNLNPPDEDDGQGLALTTGETCSTAVNKIRAAYVGNFRSLAKRAQLLNSVDVDAFSACGIKATKLPANPATEAVHLHLEPSSPNANLALVIDLRGAANPTTVAYFADMSIAMSGNGGSGDFSAIAPGKALTGDDAGKISVSANSSAYGHLDTFAIESSEQMSFQMQIPDEKNGKSAATAKAVIEVAATGLQDDGLIHVQEKTLFDISAQGTGASAANNAQVNLNLEITQLDANRMSLKGKVAMRTEKGTTQNGDFDVVLVKKGAQCTVVTAADDRRSPPVDPTPVDPNGSTPTTPVDPGSNPSQPNPTTTAAPVAPGPVAPAIPVLDTNTLNGTWRTDCDSTYTSSMGTAKKRTVMTINGHKVTRSYVGYQSVTCIDGNRSLQVDQLGSLSTGGFLTYDYDKHAYFSADFSFTGLEITPYSADAVTALNRENACGHKDWAIGTTVSITPPSEDCELALKDSLVNQYTMSRKNEYTSLHVVGGRLLMSEADFDSGGTPLARVTPLSLNWNTPDIFVLK